ncbi:MBL fold metallo-hydrolase [Romboutsia sp.]|uniref:MBL fold metallo-hydrolase n=1 Tax=Romboutsia sp. TaxID=1965302 RepID=UPI003F3778A4
MKITVLVENKSNSELKAKHGLSLYIQTSKHKILFDLGQDKTLFENAKLHKIDLSEIDTVIISHGHMDHGGALEKFLKINNKAKIYVQKKAFEKHYSKVMFFKVNVGLNPKLMDNSQIILIDGDYKIDDELTLFTVDKTSKCYSTVNDALYTKYGKDDFSHEHNLIIFDKTTTLVMGCGHSGVVNILEKSKIYEPKICLGGYHLYDPITKKTVHKEVVEEIGKEISKYDITYYTYHCTGEKALEYLAPYVNVSYLTCGEEIVL